MPTTTVTFPGQSLQSRATPEHRVYRRSNWASDWVEEYGLHCEEAVWSVAPSISTATLVEDWGDIAGAALPHVTEFEATARVTDLRDRYIKIEFDMELVSGSWTTKTWYGVCRAQEDTPVGQRWICYGLEILLADTFVWDSWWQKAGDTPVKIERGLTFNRRRKPNKAAGTWLAVHYFGSDPETNQYWSTSDCILYLLERHSPRDKFGGKTIPFALNPSPGIPVSWDRPELPTHGMSTWELLCQLLPRQRMMGFYLDVDETTAPDEITINPFSFTRDAIPIDVAGAEPIPANDNLYKLDWTASLETVYSLKISTLETFHQCIARGSRRRACFSVSVTDANLEAGWTAEHETEYELAASGAAAYAAAGVAVRERMNAEVRGSVRLRDVYARFQIPRDWDGLAGNGQGSDKYNVFNLGGAGTTGFPGKVYDLELELEPTLPMLEGVDYSIDQIRNGTFDESDSSGQEMAPVVWWKIPNTSPQRWAPVDTLARNAAVEEEASTEHHKWSGQVSVERDGRAFRVDVSGAPQHVLAETDFAALPDCNDEDLGDNDWREMIATVSVLEDRYAEGAWPETIDGAPDVARIMYINAGELYQQNYVNRKTIVDVDGDGALVETSGGYTRDDTDRLKAIARTAFAWYGQARRVLTLETGWLTVDVGLGDFVTAFATTTADGDSSDPANEFYQSRQVGSVITEVAITTPRLGPGIYDAPQMRLVTGSGELDALIFGVELDEPDAKNAAEKMTI